MNYCASRKLEVAGAKALAECAAQHTLAKSVRLCLPSATLYMVTETKDMNT